jgi:LPS-assembly protein
LKKARSVVVFAAFCVISALEVAQVSAQDAPVPPASLPSDSPPAPAEAAPAPPGADSNAPSSTAPAASSSPSGTPADASSLTPGAVPVETTPPESDQTPAVSTTPPVGKSAEQPVDITADDDNTMIGDIATADGNVIVTYDGDILYADHVIYDRSTKVVTATGNVRIYTGLRVYRGDVITYNLDTKAITSANYRALDYPKMISGASVTTPDPNHYHLREASFTTSNRQHPSFHLEARTMEYRPNNQVVMKNVLLYIGDVPVFYFPIFVQSLLDKRPAYQFDVGAGGRFGAFIDNRYNFVIDNNLRGSAELDYREKRGFAGGVDMQYFPSVHSDLLLKTYYAQDLLYRSPSPGYANPVSRGDLSRSEVYDGVPSENRYRVALQGQLNFSNDLYGIIDLNKWSDPWITRDYFQGEYQQENQPPNFAELVDYDPDFTLSLLVSPQVNPFFQTTERLPEFGIDTKQQKIFNSPIEYTSTSSMVNFEQRYADTQYFENPGAYVFNSFPHTSAYDYYHPGTQNYQYDTSQTGDYTAFRYDTYHEFSYSHQYFNFLTLTPRVGGRATYYSDDNSNINAPYDSNSKTRFAADAGLSGDFKISRAWLNVKDTALGIDGIRHVIEPFFDSEFAPSPTVTPNQIRGFDDRLYSTQLQPLDWTDYNSIDSIDKEAVVRFGVWNKIQTKRDGVNYDLATIQTYTDADFDHNFSAATPGATMSDLFNDIRIYPTPQFSLRSLSAVDVNGAGYNEIDNSLTWSPNPALSVTVGDNYINHSIVFQDSNDATLAFFYRMNEHWQFETQHQFEATQGHIQLQSYTVYRDLDAWKLALTYSDAEDENGKGDQSIFFTLTLKAFPQYDIHTPKL